MKNTNDNNSKNWTGFEHSSFARTAIEFENLIRRNSNYVVKPNPLHSQANSVSGAISRSRWFRLKERAAGFVVRLVRHTGLTALAIASMTGTLQPAQADQVTLAWDYPTNELAGVTFRVKWSNDITIPMTNWVTIATLTNTMAKVDLPRGVNFLTCTASNFWGESAFSNVASTPPVVRTNVVFTITRP